MGDQNKLSDNIDKKNQEILVYLHKKKYLPSYTTIDDDFGFQKGYFYKFAKESNKTYLKTVHTLAFETKYDVPHTLFFNEEIETHDDIEEYIKSYKKKKGIMVEYVSPESLEEFQSYKFFYILDKEKKIVEREIEIKKQSVIIRNRKSKINFIGYANVSCTSIVLVTQNAITRNSIIFKVMLRQLVSSIVPISYLGHRTNSNEEVSGYGICSKDELLEEKIREYLDVDTKDFSKIESQIIDNIKKER